MSAPRESFVGDNPELEGHVLFSTDAEERSAAERFLPETVVRRCSRCASPLSVSERMFYFIEARGSLPLCRGCAEETEAPNSVPTDLLPARGHVAKSPAPFTSGGVALELREPGAPLLRPRSEEETAGDLRDLVQGPECYTPTPLTVRVSPAAGWPAEGPVRDPEWRIRDIERGRRSGSYALGLRRVRQTELY
jgi:hypothetical protein